MQFLVVGRGATILAGLAMLVFAGAVPAQQTPPPAAPMRRWEFPAVQRFTLANGLKVVVVEKHTLPVISMRLMVDAGSMREPAEKNGVATLTGDLLRQGAGGLTGEQIAERMDQLGAQFGTSGTYSTAYVDLDALTTVFGEALDLAAKTVTEPSFPAREFERVRAEAIANYEQGHAQAEGVAQDVFFRAAFEPAAPLSRPPGGTKATLAQLTRDDVVRWHRTMYAPSTATAVLVGDVTAAEARRLLERAFGGWKAPAPALGAARNPGRAGGGTRVILVDRPGSVQSALVVGQSSILATDPEYLPMVALNRVLGGGFNARVNMNLRERHGFTYGAFSNLDVRRAGGAFYVASAVRTDATDSALVETLGEVRRIVAEPVPADELGGSLTNLVASFPSATQSVQELRARIQQLIVWGLPLDYYATYRERLGALTPSDVQRAARARLTPDALTVVVAGDLSKIEQPIRARNLGTVEVWDAEGNRLR